MESRFTATVDVSARHERWSGADATAAPRAPGRSRTTPLPGTAFDYAAADCEVCVQDAVAVLVRGRPRFAARGAGTAADWLHSYRRHGSETPAHVSGHYCAVCVDARAGRVLLVADRFATLPLCYAVDGARLLVSDRADDLPGHPRSLDPQSLFDYFYFHVVPSPHTIYQGVRRLEAGTMLVFDRSGARVHAYWVPRFVETTAASAGALRAQFRALVRQAVAEEVADGTHACFLSGGTDSSTIAGLIGEITGAPAQTYSIGFGVRGYDEMAYARIAARHFRTQHREHYVTPEDVMAALPALAASFDQPFGNSSALPAYLCARLARDDGVTRMLAGDGGDELFGGNVRYARQRVFELYRAVPAALRARVLEPLARRAPPSGPLALRKLTRYIEQARVPMPERMETYNLLQRLTPQRIFTDAFLELVDVGAPARHQRAVYQRCAAPSLVNRMLSYDWKYTLADNDLVKVRGAAALAGVQVGFPLLDDALVEFSLGLPPRAKLRGLRLRALFRDALADFLPRDILRKKKHGFGLPFGPWLAQHPGLQQVARAALRSLAERAIVRRELIADLLDAKLQVHAGYFGDMVWLLLVLEHWLRAHAPQFRVEPAIPRRRVRPGRPVLP